MFTIFVILISGFKFLYKQEVVFSVSLVLLLSILYFATKKIPRKNMRLLWATLAMLFLFRLSPSVGQGFGWWLMDELKFSPMFFGILSQVGAVMSLIVIWFMAETIARKSAGTVLLGLIFAGALMTLPEILAYYEVTEALGISNKLLFVFDTGIGSPLAHISMIPLLTLIAVSAPVYSRGLWFALASSLLNLALMGSNIMTKYLNMIFTISREIKSPEGETLVTADYSQLGVLLWTVIVLGLVVPLAGWAIWKRVSRRFERA